MMAWYSVILPFVQIICGIYRIDRMSRAKPESWWRWWFCFLAFISIQIGDVDTDGHEYTLEVLESGLNANQLRELATPLDRLDAT